MSQTVISEFENLRRRCVDFENNDGTYLPHNVNFGSNLEIAKNAFSSFSQEETRRHLTPKEIAEVVTMADKLSQTSFEFKKQHNDIKIILNTLANNPKATIGDAISAFHDLRGAGSQITLVLLNNISRRNIQHKGGASSAFKDKISKFGGSAKSTPAETASKTNRGNTLTVTVLGNEKTIIEIGEPQTAFGALCGSMNRKLKPEEKTPMQSVINRILEVIDNPKLDPLSPAYKRKPKVVALIGQEIQSAEISDVSSYLKSIVDNNSADENPFDQNNRNIGVIADAFALLSVKNLVVIDGATKNIIHEFKNDEAKSTIYLILRDNHCTWGQEQK